jgi:hypothetical protein
MTAENIEPARKPSSRPQEDITLHNRRVARSGGRKTSAERSVGPCHTQPYRSRYARGIANIPHARSAVKMMLRRFRGVIEQVQLCKKGHACWRIKSCAAASHIRERKEVKSEWFTETCRSSMTCMLSEGTITHKSHRAFILPP